MCHFLIFYFPSKKKTSIILKRNKRNKFFQFQISDVLSCIRFCLLFSSFFIDSKMLHAHLCVCMYVCKLPVYTCIYVDICLYTHVYVKCMRVCVRVYICVCVYMCAGHTYTRGRVRFCSSFFLFISFHLLKHCRSISSVLSKYSLTESSK